jgi:hypothetical protein
MQMVPATITNINKGQKTPQQNIAAPLSCGPNSSPLYIRNPKSHVINTPSKYN